MDITQTTSKDGNAITLRTGPHTFTADYSERLEYWTLRLRGAALTNRRYRDELPADVAQAVKVIESRCIYLLPLTTEDMEMVI